MINPDRRLIETYIQQKITGEKTMVIDIHQMRLVPEKEIQRYPSKVVYGPIISKRSFHSIGINLWPDRKVCSFECRYCHCGKSSSNTTLSMTHDEIMHEIEAAFQFHKKYNNYIQDIVIEGNGEPTLYPRFLEATERLIELRNKYFPNIPLVLFTNSTNLQNKRVQEAIVQYDQAFFKLDTASEKVANKLLDNKKPIANIIKDIECISKLIKTGDYTLKNFEISTAVVGSECGNYNSLRDDEFINVLKILGPQKIYLYDIDRVAPGENLDFRTPKVKMEKLAQEVFEKTNIEVIALFSGVGRGVHELSEINCAEVKQESGFTKMVAEKETLSEEKA